jgi:AcrR family transcriptional regulator
MTEPTTKDAILAAAEQLYADKGFTGTSVRAITQAAGVNTAAIHYHFGSKEALIEEMIARRAAPVNRARLAALDAIEARHPDGPLPLEDLIEAFLGPALRLRAEADDGDILPRLMARLAMESGTVLRDVVNTVFAEIRRRFVPAFRRALPGVSEDDVFWRMHMMIGSMCFAIAVPGVHTVPCEPGRRLHTDEVLERIVQFTAAGMRGAEAAREETK